MDQPAWTTPQTNCGRMRTAPTGTISTRSRWSSRALIVGFALIGAGCWWWSQLPLHHGALRYGARRLQTATDDGSIPYRIRLVLALEYMNESSALDLESSRTVPSTEAAIHFCRAVNTQVGRPQRQQEYPACFCRSHLACRSLCLRLFSSTCT
jgi:hypothetical protein